MVLRLSLARSLSCSSALRFLGSPLPHCHRHRHHHHSTLPRFIDQYFNRISKSFSTEKQILKRRSIRAICRINWICAFQLLCACKGGMKRERKIFSMHKRALHRVFFFSSCQCRHATKTERERERERRRWIKARKRASNEIVLSVAQIIGQASS